MGAKVISEKIPGYGRAYKRGFGSATGDVIITLDGDHSYPVNGISYLLEAFHSSGGRFSERLAVSGARPQGDEFQAQDRQPDSFVRHVAAVLPLGGAIRNRVCGFSAGSILEDMQLEADGMAFSEEIKIEALLNPKVRFAEIAILYTSRTGEIKLNPWRDGIHNHCCSCSRSASRCGSRVAVSIAAIIPVWNGRELLLKLLDTI